MTDITALDKLIAAVEGGKMFQPESDRWREFFPVNAVVYGPKIISAFYGSLDAAKALHDALLPGWVYLHISKVMGSCETEVCSGGPWFNGKSADPARAWLIAILKAYRSTCS